MDGVMTVNYRQQTGLIFLPILVAMAAGIILLIGNGVKVKNGAHSVSKHQAEAREIHKCLDEKGPFRVWKFRPGKKENHYVQTCRLDDYRWGMRIIEKTKRGWQERTSFVPKQGTTEQLNEYLTARAEPFNGYLSNVR